MASRNGKTVPGHYIVSIKATSIPYHIYTLNSKKLNGRTYIVFKTQRPSDTVF